MVTLTFQQCERGLEIIDPIERRQYILHTETSVIPNETDTDAFIFPVDRAITFDAATITIPSLLGVYVRSETGEMLAQVDAFSEQTFSEGTYSIEICAPMKLYLRVEGPFTTSADFEQITLAFENHSLRLGGRSHHKNPEATITTSRDPTDVMTAISHLGSALKTTSCERSYPTLRGHPPLIEIGDELDVPENLELPDSGVRIEHPPTLQYAFTVAPLAYYLGATVVPANRARIVTETGFEHALDSTRGFENEVERVLKQTFFLDCLTRTEGYYKVDLHERAQVEPLVDLDFRTLYGQSIPAQLEAYLSVPYEAIEQFVPEWKLTTHIEPSAENVETLPFVVNDLAIIKSPQSAEITQPNAQAAAINDFMRDGEFTRSAAGVKPTTPAFVEPTEGNSLEQAWIGSDAPLNASKATTNAFKNRLSREAKSGDIAITVVCNDPEMTEERTVVDQVYGSRDDLPFEVNIHHELTKAELRETLQTSADFLHYIGHIDADGFQCTDGKLDVSTLDDVGIDAFLLNACQSYNQGMGLIDAGSIGGIVTLSDVINSGAVNMGCNIARLLNRGFPLRAALNVAKNESIIGGQYIVVGDGNVDIVQAESGNPVLFEVESNGVGFDVSIQTFPTSNLGMGSVTFPNIDAANKHYLSSGELDTFEFSQADLIEYISLENIPLRVDGRFTWSDELTINDF